MLQPYPTPPRGATGQALWSYLYQLAEQLNAQAAPPPPAKPPRPTAAAPPASLPRPADRGPTPWPPSPPPPVPSRMPLPPPKAPPRRQPTRRQSRRRVRRRRIRPGRRPGPRRDHRRPASGPRRQGAAESRQYPDNVRHRQCRKLRPRPPVRRHRQHVGRLRRYCSHPAAVKAAYDLASQASSAASSAYDLANEAGQVATDAAQTAADAQSAAEAAQAAVGGKAPTNHASTGTTYGKGTSTNYGHVKLSDSILSTSDTAGGTAATPGAVKKHTTWQTEPKRSCWAARKSSAAGPPVHFKNTGQQNTTISFGTTFTAKPVVLIGQPFNGVICTVFNDAVTTSNFTVNVPAVGSATLSTRQMAWIAIGSI